MMGQVPAERRALMKELEESAEAKKRIDLRAAIEQVQWRFEGARKG